MSEKKEYHNRDEFLDDDGTTTEEKIEIARHVWETEELLYKWKLGEYESSKKKKRNKKNAKRENELEERGM